MNTGIGAINDRVKEESIFVANLTSEIEKVIVGQKYLIDRLVIGLLANGDTASANNMGVVVASSGNTIGGTVAADRNVLSGNVNAGVSIGGWPFWLAA